MAKVQPADLLFQAKERLVVTRRLHNEGFHGLVDPKAILPSAQPSLVVGSVLQANRYFASQKLI